ncbi:MAG TPA: oligosaccharide flippase family protein [Bacteroidales bacterium]|nr:oligosaccharide flippase family protein [Bacteroidales bacterium]
MASLGKNIAANYIGRSWTMLLSILFIPLYLKFMGIEAYGLVGFYTALGSVLGILDLGIGATMNRELARHSVNGDTSGPQRDIVRTLEIIYWGLAIFAGGVVVLTAPFIANTWINVQILSQASVLKVVQLMGVAIALNFPVSLYQGGLMGLERQVLVNSILIFTGTLRSVGVILILWLVSPTVEAFFAWQVFSSVVSSIVFYIAMWASLPKNAKRAEFKTSIIKSIWKYSAAISSSALIGIILSQLDKIILSKMLPLKMFGYYTLAATLASAIWMIIIPFNTALFPRLVQLNEAKKNKELNVLFHHSSQLLSLILLPVSAIFIFFSGNILLLWTHDPSVAENSHLIVSFLVLGIMLNGVASLPANCAPAFGWPLLVTYTNLIQAVFIIPLIVGMVFWLQGVGASIAWVVMNSTYIIFMVPIFFRRFITNEKRKWYLNDIVKPMLTSFSVCIISWLILPNFQKPVAIFGWIAITGLISLIATGLTLPFIRYSVINKLTILLNLKRN